MSAAIVSDSSSLILLLKLNLTCLLENEFDQVIIPQLIDEKKGRKIAAGMNIPIIGFLGLILLNHRHGYLSDEQVSKTFNQAREQHFRVSQQLEAQFKMRLEAQQK